MVKEEASGYLKIHPKDNVLVALKDLASGTIISLNNEQLQLQQNVGAKHKFFIRDMQQGEPSSHLSAVAP